jgi:L-fuconolactonase
MKRKSVTQIIVLSFFVCLLTFNGEAQHKKTNNLPRIDTHIHLYDTNRKGSSTFLDPVKHQKIYYPHLAEEFCETASPAGISYAVVIEASQRREDNIWAMSLVDDSEFLLAFIANLDPRDSTFIPDLDILSKSEKFRGIRIRPKTNIDISSQAFIAKMGELARRNLVLELGSGQNPIEAIEHIAQAYPNLKIIINHMAGGRIKNNEIIPQSWDVRLQRLSALPNVYCKISALYTLSGKSPAPIDASYYKLFIDKVVAAFGSDKVLFGSNWTLSDMLGSYTDMI